MPQFNYQKICEKFLKPLAQRQREVLERRFGLKGDERETLQKIGDGFGITRERVRQIEADSFSRLIAQKGPREFAPIFTSFLQYLKENGGLKREDILLANLGEDRFPNQVYFLLTIGDAFHRFPETEALFSFWAIEQNIQQKVKEILERVLEKLEKENKPLPEAEVLNFASSKESPQLVLSLLEVAKRIGKGPLGEFGLVDWPEIKPRGVGDIAYLTLRSKKSPLHFRDIAQHANSLSGEFIKRRAVLSQTVHNELIRDERFVLVGRGIYALEEWGYAPGTVRDIIAKILREAKRALGREEILREVQKQRLVKANTVFLNLANSGYFLKDEKGKYTIREA